MPWRESLLKSLELRFAAEKAALCVHGSPSENLYLDDFPYRERGGLTSALANAAPPIAKAKTAARPKNLVPSGFKAAMNGCKRKEAAQRQPQIIRRLEYA
jgi:hypothetical protein